MSGIWIFGFYEKFRLEIEYKQSCEGNREGQGWPLFTCKMRTISLSLNLFRLSSECASEKQNVSGWIGPIGSQPLFCRSEMKCFCNNERTFDGPIWQNQISRSFVELEGIALNWLNWVVFSHIIISVSGDSSWWKSNLLDGGWEWDGWLLLV